MLPPLPARKSYDDVPRDSLAYALFLNPLMEVDPLDNSNDEPPTLKTPTARLKHLPGKHDQSAHGKPGRVGSAFRGAYSAARAGGAGHVEARNQAKTAAEQVRQTIRDEKRADRIANPKPKRVAPPRTTPATPATPATPTTPTTSTTPTSKRAQMDVETSAKYDRIRARAERRLETKIDERTGKKLTNKVRDQEIANLRVFEEATGETVPYLQRMRDMILPVSEWTVTTIGGRRPDAVPRTREITSRIGEIDTSITTATNRRNAVRARELDARARLAKIELSNGKGIASDNSLLLAKQEYERERLSRKKLDDELKQLDKDRKAQERELAREANIQDTTTKADDSVNGTPRKYGARAGEVIAGNLGRDTGGKFTRVGNEGTIVRAAINRGVAAAGGGKRGAKRATVSAAQKKRQQADTGAGVMDKLGFDASDWDYLASDKPQDATDPQFTRLIEQGLMENVDGMAYPSALGRKIAAAAGAGNEDKARELLARDTAKRGARQAKVDAQISAYDEIIGDETASPRARAIAARKRTVLIGQSSTSTKASDGYAPPDGVQSQAKRGLALRSEFGRGGTSVGIARARDLSNGKRMSRDTIMRMVSFFARHAVDKRPDWGNPSKPSNGYIAHLLWGGDAGKSWANKIANQIKAGELIERLKHLPGKHDQSAHGKPGRVGSAFRGAYSAARAGGASHVEARNAAKTAAEQVRETIRGEKRAERAANPKPKRTKLRDETPTDTRPVIDVVTAQKHNNRIMSLKNNLALAGKDKAFALAQLSKVEAKYAGDTSDLAVFNLKRARSDVVSAQERIDRANQGIARFSREKPEGRAYTTADNPEIRAYAEKMGIPDHEGFVFTDQWKGEIQSLAIQGFRKPVK